MPGRLRVCAIRPEIYVTAIEIAVIASHRRINPNDHENDHGADSRTMIALTQKFAMVGSSTPSRGNKYPATTHR